MDVKATIQRFGLAGSTFLLHLPQELFERIWENYIYPLDFLPLAAAAAQTAGTIQIESNADFVLCSLTQVVRSVADATIIIPNPAITLTLSKQGSGRAFMPAPVDMLNYFGTVENPKVLEVPKLITRNTTIQAFLNNLDAVNARNVRLGFSGFAVF